MRTETGPLKLGDDWTGYFMRGDEALGTAGMLRTLADKIECRDECVMVSAPKWLRRFAQDLEACSERDD